MIKNTWLRKIKIQKFKKTAEIALYTCEVNKYFLVWEEIYFPGRYSWNEPLLTIALDDRRGVYGYHVFLEDSIVYKHSFYVPFYIKEGDVLLLHLNAEIACP